MHRKLATTAAATLLAFSAAAAARGVTPYLPLNLEPEIEAQIERVMILAGKPVMRRPLAAAAVLDALPQACKVDQALCEQVGRFLSRYTHQAGLSYASAEGAATRGADNPVPNSYGLGNRDEWDVAAGAYLQANDHLLFSAGVNANPERVDWAGSMVSFGSSVAQVDIGYKPHWTSPLSDTSMLLSTEAPTMPSISVSNYEPLTRFGFSYEIFEAVMSKSNHILWNDGFTTGHPRLGGLQLMIEPATGWSLSLNRLAQFGGGERGSGSLTQLLKALFNPSKYSNTNAANLNQDATNQQASITSSFVFTGHIPFAVYAEYAGEDTSRGRNYLLGNSALSWGIHFPRIAERFDLTLEASEWQNAWYTNSVYEDGMTNLGYVTGNWAADQRVYNDGVGGRSAMARIAWDATFGGLLELRYRALENQVYGEIPYHHYHEITLGYSRPWRGYVLGGEFDSGTDVFGNTFSRLSGFMRLGDTGVSQYAASDGDGEGSGPGNELLVDLGANSLRVKTDLTGTEPKMTSPTGTGAHLGLGARRAVSEHSDLGARLELDDLKGKSLLGVRLIDYRYRFSSPLALGVFLGAARYDLATPAYGFYYGLGLQWRDVFPHVDVGLDLRYYDSVARDHLLPSDPVSTRPDSFYDISGGVLSLTYHF